MFTMQHGGSAYREPCVGERFNKANASELGKRGAAVRTERLRARQRAEAETGGANGGDSPILRLSKARILEALQAGVDLDPKTLASLIQAAVRLSPAPKLDERPEELDELARRYRAAGFELPFS